MSQNGEKQQEVDDWSPVGSRRRDENISPSVPPLPKVNGGDYETILSKGNQEDSPDPQDNELSLKPIRG